MHPQSRHLHHLADRIDEQPTLVGDRLASPVRTQGSERCALRGRRWSRAAGLRFEARSYGFRPGRSCADAIKSLFRLFRLSGGLV